MEREAELARVLLVQACEECDAEEHFLTHRERERAGREARRELGERADWSEAWIQARAAHLAERLDTRHPMLRSARGWVALRPSPALLLAVGVAVGLGMDALGDGRRINLLAPPLLGLIAWNLLAYLGLALGPRLGAGRWGNGLAKLLGGPGPRALVRRVRDGSPEEIRWLTASLARFGTLWKRACGPLFAARGRRALHLGALGVAVGVVLGMYVRGLAFEYRASWESTFLEAPQTDALLSTVLGPAARILDGVRGNSRARALLEAPSIAALRAPAGDGPAAPWIHLWALTAAGAIVVPRFVLAQWAGRRARRLEATLAPPLDDPYYARLLAPARGEGMRVDVVAYSHALSSHTVEMLRELILELVGARAVVHMNPAFPYGATMDSLLSPAARSARASHWIVIFNLAQSPEEEVHGEFLEALKAHCAGGPRRSSLLVLLDEAGYRERIGASVGRDRMGQRRRAWERVAQTCDVEVAILPETEDDFDDALMGARKALWTPEPGRLQ